MDTLLRQVQQTLQQFHMLDSVQTLLVAVSGGPDSIALLHVLYRLRQELGLKLIVAHLNHQLRPDGVDDARFVYHTAHELGLLCVCESRDVRAYQRQQKLSPEDAARRVRYGFLRSTATQQGADRIALGHTADDQAETVLLRLLRGSGLKGLAGMPPVQGPLVRPLIQTQRHEILAFLKGQRLPFRDDPSNQQRLYARNRLRLDVLPLLQRHYNPQLTDTLCTTAHLLAADEAALQAVASHCLRAARLPGEPGEVRLRIGQLNDCLLALQRRVVREVLHEVSGSLHGFTAKHIAAILQLCQETSGSKRLSLPHQVLAERRYHVLHIRCDHSVPRIPAAHFLPTPGRCGIDVLGVVVESQLLDARELSPPFPTGGMAWLDAAAVKGAAWVRTRRPGDRFQPLGCPYLKKLKACLIDAKVPRHGRDQLPLVVTKRGIAWVVGVQVAEWAKVTPETQQVLCIKVTRQRPETAPITVSLDGEQ
jgi:tRNA(Ile)-lysidine synthase